MQVDSVYLVCVPLVLHPAVRQGDRLHHVRHRVLALLGHLQHAVVARSESGDRPAPSGWLQVQRVVVDAVVDEQHALAEPRGLPETGERLRLGVRHDDLDLEVQPLITFSNL